MRKSKEKIYTGRFIGNPEGYGFVTVEGQDEDIFIPPSLTNAALHDDEVQCRIVPKKEPKPVPKYKRGRRKPKPPPQPEPPRRIVAEIIEIISRKPLIGTFYTEGAEGYIKPLEKRIPHIFTVPQRSRNRFGLADGHRVVFNAQKPRKSRDDRPIAVARFILPAQVTEVLGHINDPGVDVLTLVRQFNIPYVFPEDALAQAAAITEEMELEGRRDLRGEYIFTIDGEDTKDIDDAISFEKTPDGHWRLGVHISDVSHYVKPGTPLDNEAFLRGTSVYLADRVIPMLPHTISSGICSLFPNVDRLTMSCFMTVDRRGEVLEYEITPSIINSRRRFTYGEVQELIDSEPFVEMNRLREVLSQKRKSRGALDFDLPEAKIRVDENGKPISIEPYERNHATGIIEEFMILANETVAAHALRNEIPLIYRAHEAPSPDKLAKLQGTAQGFGFLLQHGQRAIQRLLETAENSPAYNYIAMAVLTSLPQAFYTPDNPKHYGLASNNYCHFTSPIRRYADLQVHRQLKGSESLWQDHQNQSLDSIAAQCSRTEREAEALEREVAQLKKVQFMAEDIGRIYEGNISGLTPWGVYVMLPNTIEGLIPYKVIKTLGYSYDKDKNHYEAKRERDILAMGTTVRVQLIAAEMDTRRLIFSL